MRKPIFSRRLLKLKRWFRSITTTYRVILSKIMLKSSILDRKTRLQKVWEVHLERYSPKFPEHDSQMKHIFREKERCIDDIPGNQQTLIDIAGRNYYGGTNRHGVNSGMEKSYQMEDKLGYATENNVIQNTGINESPVPFDPETGFSCITKKVQRGRFDINVKTNELLLDIVSNEENYDYTASNGDRWYAKEIDSGQSVHVRVRDGRNMCYRVEDGDSIKCYTLSSSLVVSKICCSSAEQL